MALTHHRPIASPGDNRPFIFAMALLLLLLATPRCTEAQSNSSSTNGDNPYNTGLSNFNPSMAIVIVVLISAFFFLGFFSIYIRQCTGGGDGASAAGGRNAAAGRSRRQRGLDLAVLETFPTLVYSEVKGLKIGKSALECAVCLSEFNDDETLRLLPPCSHVFHPDCIDAWLASHVTCPVCRADLTKSLPDSPPAETHDHDDAAASSTQEESDHVAISINDGEVGEERPAEEAVELKRLTSQRQALRVKSVARPARFPRSHSTGHSVAVAVAPVVDVDRYTLRLPDHVRREIVAAGRLQRTRSCVAFPANEGSTRRGWRPGGGAEGSSRGGRSVRVDRWPSFLMRTISVRMPAWAAGRRADGGDGSFKKGGGGDGSFKKGGGGSEGEGSTRGKISAAVRAPFECLGGGAAASPDVDAATNESPTTPFARV